MRQFKFLKRRLTLDDFHPYIGERIFEMCREYIDHRKQCERVHRATNPNDDSYPIPYTEISSHLPEGKLFNTGTDYDEQKDKVFHTLYLDVLNNEYVYYCFRIEETEDEELIFFDVNFFDFDSNEP